MNIVLLQSRLSLEEVDQLLKEFPQYLFLSLSETSYANLNAEYWSRIEIIYGSRLTEEDLRLAHQLRWIHSPTAQVGRICMETIEKQGNVIVTNTKDEDIVQVGEFVIGVVFSFAKNLFLWQKANDTPSQVWDSKARDNMWTLRGKTFLQIGMQKVGGEIARQAHLQGMEVIGLGEKKTFHPHCGVVGQIDETVKFIDEADVVCLALPTSKRYMKWFNADKIGRLKKDSIVISLGSSQCIDGEALAGAAREGKIRGAWIDALYQTPPPMHSKLWNEPNIYISPEVAPRPRTQEKQSFRIFRYNLRQYLHGNFNDMRNVVDKSVVFV